MKPQEGMGFQAFLTENLLCAVELLTLLGFRSWGSKRVSEIDLGSA